jgi:hypothetical protein
MKDAQSSGEDPAKTENQRAKGCQSRERNQTSASAGDGRRAATGWSGVRIHLRARK